MGETFFRPAADPRVNLLAAADRRLALDRAAARAAASHRAVGFSITWPGSSEGMPSGTPAFSVIAKTAEEEEWVRSMARLILAPEWGSGIRETGA